MNTANVQLNYQSGPPLTINSPVLFGQHWNTLKPACFPKAMDVLRLWDDGTRMGVMFPSAHSFNWAAMDQRVAAALGAGKQLMYVFGSTPSWAAQVMKGPSGSYDPTSNRPPDLTKILPSITALVTRYKGKIAYYESWNEYNSSGFYCGTKAQLLDWQKAIHQVIKTIDPAAQVSSPTPCWSTTTADAEIDSLMSLGFQTFADLVTFHGYFKAGLPGSSIAPTIININGLMLKYGCSLPLWDTEFGFSGSSGGEAFFTPDQQRQWVLDAYFTRLTHGVKGMIWYMWDNFTHNPAINDITGTLNPAGQAMVDLYALLRS